MGIALPELIVDGSFPTAEAVKAIGWRRPGWGEELLLAARYKGQFCGMGTVTRSSCLVK
jgi:hypothetical protein